MAQQPVVLVINYDENNKSPNEYKIIEIHNILMSKSPDIFVLTTQDSRSGTSSHIQHSIREKIKNEFKNYYLLSKIDGTRKSDSKIGMLQFKKPYNVRTRIWINTDTVFKGLY